MLTEGDAAPKPKTATDFFNNMLSKNKKNEPKKTDDEKAKEEQRKKIEDFKKKNGLTLDN